MAGPSKLFEIFTDHRLTGVVEMADYNCIIVDTVRAADRHWQEDSCQVRNMMKGNILRKLKIIKKFGNKQKNK